MALDVSVILPDNLKSGYLQSEFISSGLAYTTNKFSLDPDLNSNLNQLALGFELRDKATRELAALKRIKTLYISNDPYFETSATIKINDWPSTDFDFNSNNDYIYDINSSFYFDNTLSQGSFGGTVPGTGLFKVNNWALSANGGLSRVYIKAIIEGPGAQLVEYPNGYGIFDTIFWEGELPVNPDNLEFSTLKSGWTGKATKAIFNSSSSFSQGNNDGISSYLASVVEVLSTNDIYSSLGTTVYRNLCPSASLASTTSLSYGYYRSGTANSYSSQSYNFQSGISLTSGSFGKGAFFYTNSKVLNSTSKPDFHTQANFTYSNASIASTSSIFLKLYDKPDYAGGSKEIVVRVDAPNNSSPTAYLYTITNNTESTNKQITTLPNSLLPLLKSGGTIEMNYSAVGSSYAYIESFFTPTLDQNANSKKSYLLANSLISSFGTTYMGGAFGYQIDTNVTETNSVIVNELLIANTKNKLSIDIGDCAEDIGIGSPVISLTDNWITAQNNDYILLTEKPDSLTINSSVNSSYIQYLKLDDDDNYNIPILGEIQLLKPSLSNNCSLEVKYLHLSDDFYVAFSEKSSYRPHLINGFQVEWDRVIGSRCIEDFALSTNPISAPTLVIKFSKDKNSISILQRDENNIFSKHNIKTYTPEHSYDRYLIELSDQSPSEIYGTKGSSNVEGTWVYIKKKNGTNIDLVGYHQLTKRLNVSENGLGYYAAVGFIKSSYDDTYPNNNRVYEIIYKSLNTVKKSKYNSIKSFDLSVKSLSTSKQYLGQKLLSGKTDFKGFGYVNPDSTTSEIELSAVSNGSNVDLVNLASQTIDGIVLSSLANDTYILLKDQDNNDENGVYKKTGPSTYQLQTISPEEPLRTISGNVNKYSVFYKTTLSKNNEILTKFISASYFTQLTIDQISPFISSIRPTLLELKLLSTNSEDVLDLNNIKVRFFTNTNDVPDYNNPLTNWLSIDSTPLIDGFTVATSSDLLQIPLTDSPNNSPMVSQGDKVWLLITTPLNTALGEAEGSVINQSYIENGQFTYFKLANNLWHKLFAVNTTKFNNQTHGSFQHLRLRSKSHGKLESHATNVIGPNTVDIIGPGVNNSLPVIENVSEATTRSVELTISADDDSGIMSFRFGKDIDNYKTQYTPWMPWSQFTVDNDGVYTIYLYGTLNYYNSGAGFTAFEKQNIGFSGPRKIWVQMMDYVGNVSESYPATFVAQSWQLVDTNPPIGSASFYNPKTNQTTSLTNLLKSVVSLKSDDIVSGVKDFKYRFIKDTGAEDWSLWEYFSNYKTFDLTNEKDGIKKIEFVFRDYGNNATQPESKWQKVMRPKK